MRAWTSNLEKGITTGWDVTTITYRAWIMHPGLMARADLVLLMTAASRRNLKTLLIPI